jgi:serine/threonine protein kinase
MKDRIEIFKQCIEGTKYIHSKKLMHQDMKPGNIANPSLLSSTKGYDN